MEGAQQAHVIAHGRVQGVNFRWTMLSEARSEGVGGWVRNRPDGSVEALVQGDRESVERVVSWMRHGPPGARVDSLDVSWSETSGVATNFEIVR